MQEISEQKETVNSEKELRYKCEPFTPLSTITVPISYHYYFSLHKNPSVSVFVTPLTTTAACGDVGRTNGTRRKKKCPTFVQ